MFLTYGEEIQSLIDNKIFYLKKCIDCGYENYMRSDRKPYYCQKCGEIQEDDI